MIEHHFWTGKLTDHPLNSPVCHGAVNHGRELAILDIPSPYTEAYKVELSLWNVNYGFQSQVTSYQAQVPFGSRTSGVVFDSKRVRFLCLLFIREPNHEDFLHLICAQLVRDRNGMFGTENAVFVEHRIESAFLPQQEMASHCAWLSWPLVVRPDGTMTLVLNEPANLDQLLELPPASIGDSTLPSLTPTMTPSPHWGHKRTRTFCSDDDRLLGVYWDQEIYYYDFITQQTGKIDIAGPVPGVRASVLVEPMTFFNPALIIRRDQVTIQFVRGNDERSEWWRIDMKEGTRYRLNSCPISGDPCQIFVVSESKVIVCARRKNTRRVSDTTICWLDNGPKELKRMCFEKVLRMTDRKSVNRLPHLKTMPPEYRLTVE